MLRYGLLIAAVVFALDQASKFLILETLNFSPPGCLESGFGCRHIEISGIFDLSMVWNQGVSFGMLKSSSFWWVLVLVQLGIAGVFATGLRSATRKLTAWSLGLVIGGAFGNALDRIRFHAVTDFLDFNGLFFPWVFNVADAAISVGAVLLALDFILHMEEKAPKKDVEASRQTG